MKNREKEKQTKQKPKEFAASPFRALKGAALELRDRSAVPVPAPAPTQKPKPSARELDDEALFLSALGDVRPLHPAKAAPMRAKVQAAKAQKDEDDQRVFLQAVEALKMDVRFSEELAEQDATRLPLPVNRLRQVRRGGIRI